MWGEERRAATRCLLQGVGGSHGHDRIGPERSVEKDADELRRSTHATCHGLRLPHRATVAALQTPEQRRQFPVGRRPQPETRMTERKPFVPERDHCMSGPVCACTTDSYCT